MTQNPGVVASKQHINTINNINRLIASSLLPDVFKTISSEIKSFIDFDQMNIILLNEKNGGFELLEFTRDYELGRLKEGTYFNKKGSLWAEVVKTRKPIILNDTKIEGRWNGNTLLKEGIRSRLAFPLEYKNTVVGIINLESGKAKNFSTEQVDLLDLIAPQVAIAVENALLLKRLSESEKKYKTIFNNAVDPLILLNPKGKIVTVNKREEAVIGYPEKELIGKEISFLLPEEYLERVANLLANETSYDKKSPTIEVEVLGKNKKLIPMELDVILIQDGEELMYTKIHMRDISEKKRALEEIQKYAEHLEKTNKELRDTQTQLIHSARLASVGQLAAGIVHQVNSPLGAISGRIQMVTKELEKIDKLSLKEHLRKIADDCTRVTHIIKDLLDLSRKAKPVKVKLNINPLLEDTIGMLTHALMSKKVECKKKLAPDLPQISGIADDLTHVFLNISNNAIDAMGESGILEIKSRLVKATKKFDNPMIEVTIKDNGHGISEKDLHRIFEPFFTTKDQGKGVGLGLAIVKRILDYHDVHIEVISKESEGTTFHLYFPLAK